jgi:NTE family protein
MAMHAFTLAVNQRLASDVERFERVVNLHVVLPLCPVPMSPADFSRSASLIERAHDSTRSWLSTSHCAVGQAKLLAPHRD